MKLFIRSLFLSLSTLLLLSCNSSPIPMNFNNTTIGTSGSYNNVRKGKRVKRIIVFISNNYSDERYISYKVKKLLINKGYILPDRQNLPAVQKEMNFCRSHLTRRCQLKLGNLTNADSILKIEKLRIDSGYVLAAELIDLATGITRWAKTSGRMTGTGGNGDIFGTLLNSALDKYLTKKGYSSEKKKRDESSRDILDRKIISLMNTFPSSIQSTALR